MYACGYLQTNNNKSIRIVLSEIWPRVMLSFSIHWRWVQDSNQVAFHCVTKPHPHGGGHSHCIVRSVLGSWISSLYFTLHLISVHGYEQTPMLISPHHCRLYWVNLYNLPTCWDLPITVDCTEWTSIIYPHVEISHHCRLYWVDLYNLPTCWDLPIIVVCTEWTSIIYPHVEISPSL